MKKIILYFIIYFLLSANCFSQSGWIKEIVGSDSFTSVHFFNPNTGLVITTYTGKIYKTTNGGQNWWVFADLGSRAYFDGYYFDEGNFVLTGSTGISYYGNGLITNYANTVWNDYMINTTLGYLYFQSTDWINVDTGFIAGMLISSQI